MARDELDLDRYLHIRQALSGTLTADGRRVVFVSDVTGVPQAWSMPVEGGWPEQLTFGDDRVAWAVASPLDPDLVVFGRDAGGNERLQLHAVRPDGLGERPLVEDPGTIHRFGDFGPGGGWATFTANDRNGVDFDLYRLDLAGGERRRVAQLEGSNAPGRIHPDGRWQAVTRPRSNADADALLVDLETGEERLLAPPTGGPCWQQPVGFAAGGVLLISDRGGDLRRAWHLDLDGGEPTPFGPEGADVELLEVGQEWGALAVNDQGRSSLHLFDAASLEPRGEVALPPGVVQRAAWSPAGDRLLIGFTGAGHPTDVWTVDPASRTARRVTRSSTAGIDPAGFVEPTLEHAPSFDGLEVPLWLYRPPGVARPPVVVSVHGGPESQERPQFKALYQYFLARGWAVAGPNVRGSSGYGARYMALDDGPRRPDSVADLAAVARWLGGRDDLDGERLAVLGGSYGGYMVLSTLTQDPELWAAGVDLVGIADLVTFLERTGDYRRALREAEYGSLEHDRELLRELSPIHRAERITAPLFVIHGRNDPRVPVHEAEQITARLAALGRQPELLVFDDEGHGIVKLANRRVAYGRVADFLARHLGS